ncbi:MAG: PC4/YdbC family ssDNA-binding protein [Bacillota bacterium]
MEQDANFWDRETVIGTVEKNATERIAVRRVERRGRAYVDIRIEWRRQDGDEFFPSKKGVVIPEEALDDVLALLESALKTGSGRSNGRRRSDGS